MPLPLACVPGAIPSSERDSHFQLAASLLHREAVERRRLPDGYGFTFPPDSFPRVARFVENERRCCPFLAFRITLSAEALRLELTGPPGTTEFLEAELERLAGV